MLEQKSQEKILVRIAAATPKGQAKDTYKPLEKVKLKDNQVLGEYLNFLEKETKRLNSKVGELECKIESTYNSFIGLMNSFELSKRKRKREEEKVNEK